MVFTKLFPSVKNRVKLGFSSIGEAVIDKNGFAFSIESLGKESKAGFLVSVSGDAVDSGALKLKTLEVHRLNGGKFKIDKYGFKRVEKKDGGFAYQVSFKNFYIPPQFKQKKSLNMSFKPVDEEALMDKIAEEVQFKFVGEYSEARDSQALIGVFPYENILDGAASKWVAVTSDKDYYKKLFSKK